VFARASDSFSICVLDQLAHLRVGLLVVGQPAASADCRDTIDSTPASCAGPITADFAPGQENRKRGPYARPHMP
jgi:hypothetical protein